MKFIDDFLEKKTQDVERRILSGTGDTTFEDAAA